MLPIEVRSLFYPFDYGIIPDYGNNLECIWDIMVPPGYVIALHFRMMDIEKSKDCTNDALTVCENLCWWRFHLVYDDWFNAFLIIYLVEIYEEHRGRGWAPNEYYYFIFDKSEVFHPSPSLSSFPSQMHTPYCDISTPPDMKTESNRIRLNFTTNEAIVGRGFELEYKAGEE